MLDGSVQFLSQRTVTGLPIESLMNGQVLAEVIQPAFIRNTPDSDEALAQNFAIDKLILV